MLPRLGVALGPWLLASARGALPVDAAGQAVALPTLAGAAVGIVLAAKGYPHTPRRGDPIDGLAAAATEGALVFHAGTVARRRPEGGYGTNGGRVLTVVGTGSDVPAARALAERAADAIGWDGLQRRRDIGLDLPMPVGAVG
jgi:phosphoribosylamine--glycine ligase